MYKKSNNLQKENRMREITMLKAYQRWNFFERRWFWSNLILTILGTYSLFIFDIIFKNVVAFIIFEAFLIYYRNIIYRSLTTQEMLWKGIIIDPITNKEITINIS